MIEATIWFSQSSIWLNNELSKTEKKTINVSILRNRKWPQSNIEYNLRTSRRVDVDKEMIR